MNSFDFKTIGIAIKRERQKAGMTRDELAEVMHISPRYLISIENDGQAPSFHVFYDLVRMFNISVDQYILESSNLSTSTAPVAPRIPTLYFFIILQPRLNYIELL